MSQSNEIVILTGMINTCYEAVEESCLGKIVTYRDDCSLNKTPENIQINQIALQAFGLILGEKVKSAFDLTNELTLRKTIDSE